MGGVPSAQITALAPPHSHPWDGKTCEALKGTASANPNKEATVHPNDKLQEAGTRYLALIPAQPLHRLVIRGGTPPRRALQEILRAVQAGLLCEGVIPPPNTRRD